MEIYTHVNMGQKRLAADALESIMAELESDPTAPTFTVIPGSKKHTGEAERAARGGKTAKIAQRKRSLGPRFSCSEHRRSVALGTDCQTRERFVPNSYQPPRHQYGNLD